MKEKSKSERRVLIFLISSAILMVLDWLYIFFVESSSPFKMKLYSACISLFSCRFFSDIYSTPFYRGFIVLSALLAFSGIIFIPKLAIEGKKLKSINYFFAFVLILTFDVPLLFIS